MATYPIIKLSDGLIAHHLSKIYYGDYVLMQKKISGRYVIVRCGDDDEGNPGHKIIAASPSLNLGITELPEINHKDFNPDELVFGQVPIPISCEIDNGKFIKYNFSLTSSELTVKQ